MDCDDSLPEDETIQDIPMFLSHQFYDIFPIFASMLDIKSFMKLAMTSKNMYKRCMEDKQIRIKVNENLVYGYKIHKFYLNSSVVSAEFTNTYLSTLEKLRCTVNLETFEVHNYETSSSMIDSAYRYLARTGVKKIEKLSLSHRFSEWSAVIPFIKDFHVDVLEVSNLRVNLSSPVLQSLLQLNLKEFTYNMPVPIDLLFEINSPIQKLMFNGINNIPKDKFTQILWMIQTGSLNNLTVPETAVDWSSYDKLSFYHQGPIPDDRPLLFARTKKNQIREYFREYWFLHWQGGVTKCVVDNRSGTLEVFKCEPHGFPPALRENEDILKDLREMRSETFCLVKHFRMFSESFIVLDPSSLEGSFPTERPLYFKDPKGSVWRLDENDILMKYSWKNGCATWERGSSPSGHPELTKYMFWNQLKKNYSHFRLYCDSHMEFDSLFEDCTTFDYDYIGPLPEERPLVFGLEGCGERVVVFNDFPFKCKFGCDKSVEVDRCLRWDFPLTWTQVTAGVINHILQNKSRQLRNAYVNVPVSLKTFRDGVKLFASAKNSPVWTKNNKGKLIEESWYSIPGAIMKVMWKEGRLVRTPHHLRESPKEFMKMVFKEFARKGECTVSLELEQFESCLEQFTIVPFDYSGSLKSASPLVFLKKKIRHSCDNEPHCHCSDVIIHTRFFWEVENSTHCSWGEEEPKKIMFKKCADRRENQPLAMKTKEYLQMLLETKYDSETQYEWFGEIDDFLAFFDGFKKFPFDYKGRLPKKRPLVFENNSIANEPVRFFLREDNSVVKCKWSAMSRKEAHLSLPRCKRLAPRATWKFL